jgi:hypothetical protein
MGKASRREKIINLRVFMKKVRKRKDFCNGISIKKTLTFMRDLFRMIFSLEEGSSTMEKVIMKGNLKME